MSISKKEYKYWDMDIVQIGRKIKGELVKEFPAIKFTVKTKRNQSRIDVRIHQIHRKYLKDRGAFLHDLKKSNVYMTDKEYKQALAQFDYTDYVVSLAVKDDVWNRILQIYDKYNYFNNDLDHDIVDQRYYGGVQLDWGCRAIGEVD